MSWNGLALAHYVCMYVGSVATLPRNTSPGTLANVMGTDLMILYNISGIRQGSTWASPCFNNPLYFQFSTLNVYHPYGCHFKGQSLIMWPAGLLSFGGGAVFCCPSFRGRSFSPSLVCGFISALRVHCFLFRTSLFSLSLVLVICSQRACVCVCVYTLDSSPSLWLSKEPFWARGEEEGSSMLLLSCDCDLSLSLVGLFLSCWDPTSYFWEFLFVPTIAGCFWGGGSSRFQFRLTKYYRPVGILYFRFGVLGGGGGSIFVVF
jgi:hypothetical protein